VSSSDGVNPTLAQRSADAMRAGDAALRFFGVELDAVSAGRARARMTVTAEMINGHGVAHGSCVFALADIAFSYACNTEGDAAVARQCEITFLRPAQVGDQLVAVAELRSRTGRSGIYDVRVSRSDGEVVAELRGHSAALVRPGADR